MADHHGKDASAQRPSPRSDSPGSEFPPQRPPISPLIPRASGHGLILNSSERLELRDAVEAATLHAFPIQPIEIIEGAGVHVSFHPRTAAHTAEITISHTFTARFNGDENFNDTERFTQPIREVALRTDISPPDGLEPQSYSVESSLAEEGSPVNSSGFQDFSKSSTFTQNLAHLNPAAPRLPIALETRALRHPLEIDPKHVLVGNRIAVGGFAEIFLCKYQGTLAAAKLLLNLSEQGHARFLQEVETLASLRHPNLLLFLGFVVYPYFGLITEYMGRGSLFKVMRASGDKPIDTRLARSVAVQVAKGMTSLHCRSPPMLHLDLKSPNILLDDKWRVKIADFGLARLRMHSYVTPGAPSGTPEWMAPEVLRCEQYNETADVYSYGVVLWELLTGRQPWAGMLPVQVVGAVGFQGRSLALPTTGDPFLIQICKECMDPNPNLRPSFTSILKMLETEYAPSGHVMLSTSLSHVSLEAKDQAQGFSSSQTSSKGTISPSSFADRLDRGQSIASQKSVSTELRHSASEIEKTVSTGLPHPGGAFAAAHAAPFDDAARGNSSAGVRFSGSALRKPIHPHGSMTNSSPFAER